MLSEESQAQMTNIPYDSIMGHHPGKSETIGREIRSMLRMGERISYKRGCMNFWEMLNLMIMVVGA